MESFWHPKVNSVKIFFVKAEIKALFFNSLTWLLIYLTLFLAPLCLLYPLVDSVSLPKYFFLTAASSFLLFLFFLHWLFNQENLSFFFPPFIFFLLLLSWSLFSSLFSLHPFTAFYGNPHRYYGWLSFLAYLVFALAFLFLKPGQLRIVSLFKLASFSGALVSLIGLAQGAGFGLRRFSLDPARASSTLGNPVFLASFLLLTLFPTLYLVFWLPKSKNLFLKVLFFLFLVVQLSALYLTYSRAAWGGFLLSLFLFFLFLFKLKERERLRQLLSFLLLAFLLSFSLAYLSRLLFLREEVKIREAAASAADSELLEKLPGFFPERVFLPERVKERITSAPTAFKERLELYRTALKAVNFVPFFGSGLDCYHLLLGKIKLGFFGKSGKLRVTDRPHNDFLETAAMLGLPGLLFYLALLFYLFLKTLSFLFQVKRGETRFLVLTLFAALTSYLFSLQFSFHTLPTALYFYSFVSLLLVLLAGKEGKVLTFKSPVFLPFSFKALAAALFFCLFLFFFYRFSLTPLSAEGLSEKAVRMAGSKLYLQAIENAEKAVGLMPGRSDYFLVLGESYRQWGLQSGDFSQLDMALYYFRKAVEVNPYQRFHHLKLAVSLLQAAEATGKKAYAEESIEAFKEVAKFTPDYFEVYYNLGVAYYYLEDLPQARFYLEKTLKLNQQEKDAWFLLGKVAERERKLKEALFNYRKSLELWAKEKKLKGKRVAGSWKEKPEKQFAA